jgi:predicted transcriptional regulator
MQCPNCERMNGHNQICFRINDDVLGAIDSHARKYGVTRACVLREALANYLGITRTVIFREEKRWEVSE